MKKKTVTCEVKTAQYEDETIKCEKKVRESLNVKKEPNVKKELLHVMLEHHNVRMELSSVRKK